MKVCLLGCGLIGGSIGLALKQADPSITITGYDRSGETRARALERGAVDATETDPATAVEGADVIFIATPVGAIAQVASDARAGFKPGAVITDVGSTKSRVVVDVEACLPRGVHFIGGHPMAGTEEEGIDSARPDLFAQAWWVLTPTDQSDADAYRILNQMVTTLGARVMALKPEEHDELMAIVSHVPHLTATALMNMAAERGRDHGGLLALAAGGFRDVTRVAASNPEIWIDICRENRDAIMASLEQFAGRLLQLRDLVEQEDEDGLRRAFLDARTGRRSLPGKQTAGDLYELRFPIPDRPGILAEVTTAIGNLGVNIEDLQISHASEGGRGTLRLQVVGEMPSRKVRDVLRSRGFIVKAMKI